MSQCHDDLTFLNTGHNVIYGRSLWGAELVGGVRWTYQRGAESSGHVRYFKGTRAYPPPRGQLYYLFNQRGGFHPFDVNR